MCGKKNSIKNWCKHLRALGKKIKMKEFDSSNIGEDPFSEHITDSKDCFKLTGPNRTIFIHPQDNDCSLCGKKFSTKTWCDHLVSAGRKMDIPVFVRPINNGTASLTKIVNYQNTSKAKTGRKKPKANDYMDVDLEDIPDDDRATWMYRRRQNLVF